MSMENSTEEQEVPCIFFTSTGEKIQNISHRGRPCEEETRSSFVKRGPVINSVGTEMSVFRDGRFHRSLVSVHRAKHFLCSAHSSLPFQTNLFISVFHLTTSNYMSRVPILPIYTLGSINIR